MSFEEVRDIIIETLSCEPEHVTLETNLADDLEADSLAVVELIMALEDASGITVAEEDTSNLKTVGDIVDYLNAHKA